MRQLKHPATIVAAIALFIALGGGMAVAAGGLISGSKIKDHSIAAKKLTSAAVTALTGSAYSATNNTGVVVGVTQATVDTLTLGAGSYIVMGKTTLYNLSASDDVVCYLMAPDNSQLDLTYGSFYQSGPVEGQTPINVLAPVTTTGGTFTMQCLGGNAGSSAIYSRMTAIKVGTVTGTAGHFPGTRKPNTRAGH